MSRAQVVPRLPGIALALGMVALFLAIPYASFTSDVANFGLMGNDILKYGYLPTLTYGQSYLFSMTPYAYAAVRALAGGWISDIVALKLAGAIFSVSGILLIMESLLMAQRQTEKPQTAAMALFALMIASSDAYLFDASLNSSNEISIFLVGALMFLTGRIDSAQFRGAAPLWRDWFFLGMTFSLMWICRPMLLTFALGSLPFLLAGSGAGKGWRSLNRPLALLAAGAALGYAPMIAHWLFRAATWPYHWFLPLVIGGGIGVENAVGVLIHVILPRLMTMLWEEAPARYVITALWLTATFTLIITAALRQGKSAFTVTDRAWLIGQSSSILIMAMIPSLSGDTGARRYCLHLLPMVAWMFCRFAFPMGRVAMVAIALAVALAISSAGGWKDRLAYEYKRNGQIEQTVELAAPELQALNAVIFTDYWDAYLLSFITAERVIAEAFPWQITRRYGYFTEQMVRRRTVWLVCDGYATATQNQLAWELGEEAVGRMKRMDLTNMIVGRRCEAWDLPEPSMAVDLINKYHPAFFRTSYPPR
ncbi:MAG: hypothetical protein OEV92_05585 [Nitrospinota bacterium]|nr:hypothetical protein [Nitrospinota bacterium]